MGPLEIAIRTHLTVWGYGRTYQLAARAGIATARMRDHMQRLEARGVVQRSERYSAVNDICWVLAESPTSEGVATTPTADGEASKPKARATEPESETPANHTEESKP